MDKISKNRKRLSVLYFNSFTFKINIRFCQAKANYKIYYLKPTDACQTNANKRKNTGIAGITSTIGRNAVYGSGKADSKKVISIIS